jgi:D-glycero-alpha-D-manno-heptose-7-phosphate kinase
MIIVRSPLRISLGGGGTDLPSYYRDHTGFLLAGAIDKYLYVMLNPSFGSETLLRYSSTERVSRTEDIQHPILRKVLQFLPLNTPVEINSISDIPGGTGLGSSGSFTTALLKAIYIFKGIPIATEELARQACMIEIEHLGRSVGKQDPYVAAYGGIMSYKFLPDERVEVVNLNINKGTLKTLEDNLLLFFTGSTRSASDILADQEKRSLAGDAETISNLDFTKELGERSAVALEAGDLPGFVELMNVHWQFKRNRSRQVTNDYIDSLYELGRSNGALGGKLVGAGGGGFLMFYAEAKERLRLAMRQAGLQEVCFKFASEGVKVMLEPNGA